MKSGGLVFWGKMNWTEKANEIAERIIKREIGQKRISQTCELEHLSRLLAESAIEGMKHECDNWLL